MPYRESSEDPRIDAIRRTHTVAEQGEVARVVKRFEDELESANSSVADAANRLYRAQQGHSTWLFRTPPDPAEIERELREVEACREARGVAEVALQLARGRARVLGELLDQSPVETTSTDPYLVNAAVAASVRAVGTHGRDVRKHMRETVTLVTDAHRQEITVALTGEAGRVHALPIADRAVTLVRCRIELLRANVVALGTATAASGAALGEVITMLKEAGTGPGQAWKNAIIEADKRLDDILGALERI